MSDFMTDGSAVLPDIKSDARVPSIPIGPSEWASQDANRLRQALLDLRTSVLGTSSGFANPNVAVVTAVGSTTGRTLESRFGEVVNVLDFGADKTGVADSSAAFTAAIAVVPAQDGSWVDYPPGYTSKSSGANKIIVPAGVYRIDTELVFPEKHFNMVSPTARAARLVNNTGGNYIIRMASGNRSQGIEGIVFDGGGLELDTLARGQTWVWDCEFQDCPSWAIHANGISIVYFDIYRNTFSACKGSISNNYHDNDGWRIKYNQITRNWGNPDFEIASSGVTLEDNDHEVRQLEAGDTVRARTFPYVHLRTEASFTSGFPFFVELRRNRFGCETETIGGKALGHPREAVVVGPLPYENGGTYAIGEVMESNGSCYEARSAGTASAAPTHNGTDTDGTVLWTFQFYADSPNALFKGAWAQGLVVAAGDFVYTPDNYIRRAYNSGTCGSTLPTGTGTVSDGAVTWGYLGAGYGGVWTQGQAAAANEYRSVSTRLYRTTAGGVMGATTPTWTNDAVAGGITWRWQMSLGAASSIIIDENYFLGTNNAATASEANSAVRFTMPPNRVTFRNNHVRKYYGQVIHESYMDGINGASSARDNYWSDDRIESKHTAPFFSHGGIGWAGAPVAHSTDPHRPAFNMLRDGDLIDSSGNWTRSNVTVAKDATGPDGVASSAFTVTRTGSNAQIGASTSPNAPAAITSGLTYSVWLKAGSLKQARVSLYASSPTSKFVSGTDHVFKLTDEWQRVEVFAPYTPIAGPTYYTATVKPSSAEDNTGSTGTILMYGPMVQSGRGATAYTSALALGTRVTGQQNGLVLGNMVVGYGSVAPASGGRYEIGDIVINNAPSTGTAIGWRCTTAGSPGVWETLLSAGTSSYEALTQANLTTNVLIGTGKKVVLYTPNATTDYVNGLDGSPAYSTGDVVTIIAGNGNVRLYSHSGGTTKKFILRQPGVVSNYYQMATGDVITFVKAADASWLELSRSGAVGAQPGLPVTTTWANPSTPDLALGDSFVITVTSNNVWQIATPANGHGARRISIRVKRNLVGAPGYTWSTIYKAPAGSFAVPADGYGRTFQFEWDGTNWIMISDSGDVAN